MLTLKDVADELNLSLTTVRRIVAAGLLQANRFLGQYRVSREALEDFIGRTVVEPVAKKGVIERRASGRRLRSPQADEVLPGVRRAELVRKAGF